MTSTSSSSSDSDHVSDDNLNPFDYFQTKKNRKQFKKTKRLTIKKSKRPFNSFLKFKNKSFLKQNIKSDVVNNVKEHFIPYLLDKKVLSKPLNTKSLIHDAKFVGKGFTHVGEKGSGLRNIDHLKTYVTQKNWTDQNQTFKSGSLATNLKANVLQIKNQLLRNSIVVVGNENGFVSNGGNINCTFIIALASGKDDDMGHWLVFYRVTPTKCIAFDSYGRDIFDNEFYQVTIDPKLRVQLGDISQPFKGRQFQTTVSGICGIYCLLFILCQVFKNKPFDKVLKLRSIKVKDLKDTDDLKDNDQIVFACWKEIFYNKDQSSLTDATQRESREKEEVANDDTIEKEEEEEEEEEKKD